jgi:hypothetical protein
LKHIDRKFTSEELEAIKLHKNKYSDRLTGILQVGLQILLNRLQADPTKINEDFVGVAAQVYEIALTIKVLNFDNEEFDLEKMLKHLDKCEKEFGEGANNNHTQS